MCDTKTILENRVRDIAETLDLIVSEGLDENGDTLDNFFDDVYDVKYGIGYDLTYHSVKVCVACGGPNIYVDTASCTVKGYWGRDKAEYPLDMRTVDDIDSYWNDIYCSCRAIF